jgi:hypothetical protein
MLGHANTEMVRKHYAPWVKELDIAHVRMDEERRLQAFPTAVSAWSLQWLLMHSLSPARRYPQRELISGRRRGSTCLMDVSFPAL